MNKINTFKTAAIVVALSFTSIAHAETFQFNTDFGGVQTLVTFDTTAGTVSYVGGNTNVTFGGADLSNFANRGSNDQYFFSSASGVISANGRTFEANANQQPRIRFLNNGNIDLWAGGFDADGRRRNVDIDGSLTPFTPPPVTSTSTGGLSSTGGTPGTPPAGGSGGTDVPAPGILGLLGLGLAGLAFGRRRKTAK